jgi:hypothetical protein
MRDGVTLEARGGIEPPLKVLQTFALPLGDRAESGSTQKTRIASNDSISFLPVAQIIFGAVQHSFAPAPLFG